MNGQLPKQWGLYPPLSQALPNEKQLAQNDAMVEELKRNNNFEAPEETDKRTEVLKTFQKTCVEFIKMIGKGKGMTDKQAKDLGGKVATFGSFRLGVFGPGSDIDALVIAPKHVTREDFFDHFPSLLQKMSSAGAIEEMKPVPDAYVPIIKLEYSGISIDLIFATLKQSSIPFNIDMKDDTLLRGIDDMEMRCINGVRVSDMITSLVPQLKTFRSTLRTIKLWAQRRAIYGNVFGFPGGVAWAMMVASVCQSYPQACASVVVGKFFHLIRTWSWPRPILLKQIDQNPVGMDKKIWNAELYRGDKNHLMPVITPAYPSMCATHNITRSTRKIILDELRQADTITTQIYDGKQQWSDLFTRSTFFTRDFKYYLCVVSASKTKEAQAVWSGLIESKVRRLVSGIEDSQVGISLARPYVKAFHRVHRADDEEQVSEILQGKVSYLVTDSKSTNGSLADDAVREAAMQAGSENVKLPNGDPQVETQDDTKEEQKPKTASTIYTTTYYIGIDLAEGSKSLDVSFAVGDFIRQCNMWPQYDADINSVKVVHVRNYALPDDVFQAGEVRPSRPLKKGKISAAAAAAPEMKKRSFSNSNMEASYMR